MHQEKRGVGCWQKDQATGTYFSLQRPIRMNHQVVEVAFEAVIEGYCWTTATKVDREMHLTGKGPFPGCRA
jgi:hypothetical protein